MSKSFLRSLRLNLVAILFLLACSLFTIPVTDPPIEMPISVALATPTETMTIAAVELPDDLVLTWVDGSKLVFVPEGDFVMGDGGGDNPQLIVHLDAFWIYSTKVTTEMYKNCIAAGTCTPSLVENSDNSFYTIEPVVEVTWEQASTYCNWLQARLPSEAEWEKTARGAKGNIYPWGEAAPNCNLLNFNNCVGMLSFVTDYPNGQSYFGALDMAGNASEWVADWYDPQYYYEAVRENPIGPQQGEFHSVRGSGFLSGPQDIRSAKRFFLAPEESRADLGFRCVVDDPRAFAPYCTTAPISNEKPTGTENCPAVEPKVGLPFCWRDVEYVNVDIPSEVDAYVVDTSQERAPGEEGDIKCYSNPQTQAGERLTCVWSPQKGYVTTLNVCTGFAPRGLPGRLSCQPGYTIDPATEECVFTGQGWEGNCPAGFIFDEDALCCKAQTEAQTPLCEPPFVLRDDALEGGLYCAEAYEQRAVAQKELPTENLKCSESRRVDGDGGSACPPGELLYCNPLLDGSGVVCHCE